MITGVAFVPQAPALVPGVGLGLDAELGPVRAACGAAVQAVVSRDSIVLVLGEGAVSQFHPRFSRGRLDGFGPPVDVQLGGTSCGGRGGLSPALSVAAWVLHGFGRRAEVCAYGVRVGPDWSTSAARDDLAEAVVAQDVAILVAGDGSACRTEKAPGYLDERATGFDAATAAALQAGDPAALQALDADLGAELAAAGVPAWHALAEVTAGSSWDAELTYDDAPFGVGYFVATWLPRAEH